MPKDLEFFFNGFPVGFFEEKVFPTKPGLYRYMPHRGPGQYELVLAQQAGTKPQCSYETVELLVRFLVVDCPQYGVLEHSEFERLPKTP